ncbi:MAG TPA: presqualene diphosphate synthase HpnD [Candidatus Binatia bacterium]|nr:presqualene diphosphate synthase HpnD [Candidatus Binatia bacterium]
MRRRSNFGVAFAILPRPQREAIRAVHAWSRALDDGVDEDSDTDRARARLERFRRELVLLYEGVPEEPLTAALRPHVERFHIPRFYFDELINGVEMDLSHRRYGTFAELHRYCYRVASIVGLICLRIFGEAEERGRRYAENLGLALQLTNILRDVGSDLSRGRVYLPTDELARFGVSEEALRLCRRDRAFLDLMRFQAERARSFFEAAEREVSALDRRRLLAAEIMAGVYRRLLERIEASGFDVLSREVRVSKLERVWIAASTALAVRSPR